MIPISQGTGFEIAQTRIQKIKKVTLLTGVANGDPGAIEVQRWSRLNIFFVQQAKPAGRTSLDRRVPCCDPAFNGTWHNSVLAVGANEMDVQRHEKFEEFLLTRQAMGVNRQAYI